MTNEDIIKFQRRAKLVAAKKGYSELADDFAQEVLLEFIENPDRRSTIDQMFIDYLRRMYGDARTISGTTRSRAEHSRISIDVCGNENEGEIGSHERIAAIETDSESERTVQECSHLFTGREAEIYEAYFVKERTEKDIGASMQITDSRVSQLIKHMKKEIENYYVLRDGLERMEWDTEYLKVQVDWIKL